MYDETRTSLHSNGYYGTGKRGGQGLENWGGGGGGGKANFTPTKRAGWGGAVKAIMKRGGGGGRNCFEVVFTHGV